MALKQTGANDRIRLGFIGVANRGGQLLSAFLTHDDMEVVALCDVQGSTLAAAKERLEKLGGKPDTYEDFRKVLERKDIDAVVIATPDHWHAIQTIEACRAGKDVYVEKPVSITVREGRRMVEVARETKRVVTVGLHRRSAPIYAQAAEFVHSGKLGQVTVSRTYHRSNLFPMGIGKEKPSDPPADLNWDMWLGPRPERPFQVNIAPYKFRWWTLYSSQTSNNGVHFFDCVRWITGDEAPTSICAIGGKYVVDDDRTIPDTLHVTFQFPSGRLLNFGMFESSGNRTLPRAGYFEIRGTQGTMYCSDPYFEVIPERGGQFQDSKPRGEEIKVEDAGSNRNHTALHARNFLDCIRSREKPNCDVEEGHRSTLMSLLAKISHTIGKRLEWDPVAEKITNYPEANELLHYEYRAPWKLG
ncbi:MAG: Gfo/Idh/MocA family oxidoreductase [Planctomycetaceae bacterium]|mgnify:FL=1|nr:Gfo/Idh/MocA family oxidoreductase [Planctomycetaceae bacterium]